MKLILAFLLLLLPLAASAAPDPLKELRYCTSEPKRDAQGRIFRRADVIAAFKRAHACPANGKRADPCPGWAIDHVIPLAVGGCDAVSNLQWLPVEIKSCADKHCKDRWERTVYGREPAP